MTRTLWSLLRSMSGLEAGRACRGCQEPIHRRDRFGLSEAVCGPCRTQADR